jgi:Uma2 family endonuclease
MIRFKTTAAPPIEYPDSDGAPVGETPQHCLNLLRLLGILDTWFAADEMTYVAGNSFLYYEEGNPRRHVSPDVFVVRGIPRRPLRRRYLVCEEGKAPDFIIELTSSSTHDEDVDRKFAFYRDRLKVQEYFIRRVKGRLPSKVIGLHLVPSDWELRLYDPAADRWLPTPPEEHEALLKAQEARLKEQEARLAAEAEVRRLQRELKRLRGERE